MVPASLSEPVLRFVLASVRCLLELYSDRTRGDNHYESFFFIALPVSLAFFSVMIGDILALKKFRSNQKTDVANRGVLALLHGCEAWQMISICHFEESRPLAQLLFCVCLVFVMGLIPDCHRSQLLSACLVLICFCYEHEVLNFEKHRSGFLITLYALVVVGCAASRSTFLKYCLHLCIVIVDFHNHDCMFSGMILMAAVSRIGVAIAMKCDAKSLTLTPKPCGVSAPCMPGSA